MTEFSKILSYYVKERKTNISALATETKIERTLLHKYISGTRTPSDIKSVQTIAKSLMLSHDEKCRLTEAYKMTCMGEETYFQKFSDPELASMRNVAGEIFGARAAMEYAIEHDLAEISIFISTT